MIVLLCVQCSVFMFSRFDGVAVLWHTCIPRVSCVRLVPFFSFHSSKSWLGWVSVSVCVCKNDIINHFTTYRSFKCPINECTVFSGFDSVGSTSWTRAHCDCTVLTPNIRLCEMNTSPTPPLPSPHTEMCVCACGKLNSNVLIYVSLWTAIKNGIIYVVVLSCSLNRQKIWQLLLLFVFYFFFVDFY